MPSNARVITVADSSGKNHGRSATEWRNDFALTHFAGRAGCFSAQTQNKKAAKPVFEVHEREIGHREYRLTLMQRNNANHLSEVESVRVGMFGKLLDKPSKTEQSAPTPVEEVQELVEA